MKKQKTKERSRAWASTDAGVKSNGEKPTVLVELID
jgi:hypothetical protein